MSKLNITPGNWELERSTNSYKFITSKGHWEQLARVVVRVSGRASTQGEANAELMVDAGNTANKCDLLPSELLAQRDELLKEKEQLLAALRYTNRRVGNRKIAELIKKMKNNEKLNNNIKLDFTDYKSHEH